MEAAELRGAIESILFVAGEPLPKAELMRVFSLTALELNAALADLAAELADTHFYIQYCE